MTIVRPHGDAAPHRLFTWKVIEMSGRLAFFAAAFGCLTATVCTGQSSPGQDVIGNVPGRGMSISRVQQSSAALASPATSPSRPAGHPEASPSVFVGVMGQVKTPGVFEFTTKAPNLKDLIKCAGGRTQFASGEYYVVSATRPLTRIEPNRDANTQFANGDVVLVETSARNYHELGRPGTTLATLHPWTQVALFNVTDRPVILSRLKPEQARLPSLLTMLRQTQRAARGLRAIIPPNAREIPSAALAPNLIPSGTSLIFDPTSLNRTKLPTNWPHVLSGEAKRPTEKATTSIRNVSHQGQAPPPPVPGDNAMSDPSRQLADSSAWSLPFPRDEQSQKLSSAQTADFTSIETPQSKQIFEPDQDLAPVSSQTASRRKSNAANITDEALPNEIDVDVETASSTKNHHSVLSSQQRGYVIGFFVIVALFGVAYWVRQRGAAYGYSTRKFAYNMNHQGTAADAERAKARTATVHMTPKAEPLTGATLVKEPAPEGEGESAETSSAKQVETQTEVAEPAPTAVTPETRVSVVDSPEIPPATAAVPAAAEEPLAERAAGHVDKPEAVAVVGNSMPPIVDVDSSLEPETRLDLELFEKLIEGQLKIEREPAEPTTKPAELPPFAAAAAPEHTVEMTDEDSAPPPATPKQFEPQPLFPIIWNRATQPESEPADLRRFVPVVSMDEPTTALEPETMAAEPVAFDEMRPDAILPERIDGPSPAVSRPKMLDRGTKRGALLDRVLQAVHRERKK